MFLISFIRHRLEKRRARINDRERAAERLERESWDERAWDDVFLTSSGVTRNIRNVAYPKEYVRPHADYLRLRQTR